MGVEVSGRVGSARVSWYAPPGSPPPGWYPDPSGHGQRFWDGERWTEHYVWPTPGDEPAGQLSASGGAGASPLPPLELWVACVALVVLVIGSVGPWVTLQAGVLDASVSQDVGGLRGDAPGGLALVMGLASAVVIGIWQFERVVVLPAVGALAAAVAAAVAIVHIVDPAAGTEVPGAVTVQAAWGVWVTLVASLALLGAAGAMVVRTRTST
jgi:hypothetical protein